MHNLKQYSIQIKRSVFLKIKFNRLLKRRKINYRKLQRTKQKLHWNVTGQISSKRYQLRHYVWHEDRINFVSKMKPITFRQYVKNVKLDTNNQRSFCIFLKKIAFVSGLGLRCNSNFLRYRGLLDRKIKWN